MNLKTTAWNVDNHLAFAKAASAAYDDDMGVAALNLLGFDTVQALPIYDDIVGVVASNADGILCLFRGTISQKDGKLDLNNWLTDSEASQVAFQDCFGVPQIGSVHEGFASALLPLWKDLQDEVNRQRDRSQGLWFAGHSLGGSLAHLAASAYTFSLREPVNGIYTYGQPRVGDIGFCTLSESHMGDVHYRSVNAQDIVTRIPPRIFPHFPGVEYYGHSGRLVYFDDMGVPHNDEIFWNSFMASVDVGIQNMQGLIDGMEVKDHFMANYIAKIQAARPALQAMTW
jgi:triacylglycerol lipase